MYRIIVTAQWRVSNARFDENLKVTNGYKARLLFLLMFGVFFFVIFALRAQEVASFTNIRANAIRLMRLMDAVTLVVKVVKIVFRALQTLLSRF